MLPVAVIYRPNDQSVFAPATVLLEHFVTFCEAKGIRMLRGSKGHKQFSELLPPGVTSQQRPETRVWKDHRWDLKVFKYGLDVDLDQLLEQGQRVGRSI